LTRATQLSHKRVALSFWKDSREIKDSSKEE
jgi:hypothetical protein